ncbi:MAG: formylglycine-generating enzyme family protein, partial [Bdellovibrionales bacterium]|nr:formylglycine-generating enzyme family protein [Bdellovibrionales bacterium]
SWFEAKEFIKNLNSETEDYTYRLPTEAEWEYAARSGTTTSHWFGEIPKANTYKDPNVSKSGWYWYNRISPVSTIAVTQKLTNPWGLFDMIGNVSEWVEDTYEDSFPKTVKDPVVQTSGRYKVFRGGSTFSHANHTRSAYRMYGPGTVANRDIGLRLVRVKKSLGL